METTTWATVAARSAVRTMTRCWLPGAREIPGSVGWLGLIKIHRAIAGWVEPPSPFTTIDQALRVPGILPHLAHLTTLLGAFLAFPAPAWLYSLLSSCNCLRLHHRSYTIMASRLPLAHLSRQHMMTVSRLPYASRGFSVAGRRCVSSAALQMRVKSGLRSGSSLHQVPASG